MTASKRSRQPRTLEQNENNRYKCERQLGPAGRVRLWRMVALPAHIIIRQTGIRVRSAGPFFPIDPNYTTQIMPIAS